MIIHLHWQSTERKNDFKIGKPGSRHNTDDEKDTFSLVHRKKEK